MHPRQKNILRNKLCFTSKSIEGSTFWTPKELLCAEFSLNIETFVFADDHTCCHYHNHHEPLAVCSALLR